MEKTQAISHAICLNSLKSMPSEQCHQETLTHYFSSRNRTHENHTVLSRGKHQVGFSVISMCFTNSWCYIIWVSDILHSFVISHARNLELPGWDARNCVFRVQNRELLSSHRLQEPPGYPQSCSRTLPHHCGRSSYSNNQGSSSHLAGWLPSLRVVKITKSRTSPCL